MHDALRNRKDIFPDTLVGNGVDQGAAAAVSTVKRQLESPTEKSPKTPRRSKGEDSISKCVSLIEKIVEDQRKNEARRLDILDKIANSLAKWKKN